MVIAPVKQSVAHYMTVFRAGESWDTYLSVSWNQVIVICGSGYQLHLQD